VKRISPGVGVPEVQREALYVQDGQERRPDRSDLLRSFMWDGQGGRRAIQAAAVRRGALAAENEALKKELPGGTSQCPFFASEATRVAAELRAELAQARQRIARLEEIVAEADTLRGETICPCHPSCDTTDRNSAIPASPRTPTIWRGRGSKRDLRGQSGDGTALVGLQSRVRFPLAPSSLT